MYKDRWIPVTNEELRCRCEPGNIHNPYAVAVENSIVGRDITSFTCLFASLIDVVGTGFAKSL